MSIVMIATAHPHPAHVDEVIDVFCRFIPEVHAEPGCELYALHREGDDLVLIEKWASQEALDAHSAGPVLAELRHHLQGLMRAASDVRTLTPVGDCLGAGAVGAAPVQ